MRILIVFSVFVFSSCGRYKHTINPEARKLNDSAVYIATRTTDYSKAITLLDQATQIDSTYFTAYNNKFSFLGLLKPIDIDKILKTLKKINQLRPEYPDFYLYIGIIYAKQGDSIISQKYLTDAIVHYDKFLDTMHKSNTAYVLLLLNKAFCLILKGQEKKGDDILKQAYAQEIDTFFKKEIASILVKSRKEILDSLSIK